MERTAGQSRRRWIVWAIGVVAVVALVFALASRDQSPRVQVTRVKRENLSASISSNGKVEPIAPFIARAQFATFVEKVAATEGQTVHQGEVILTLNADGVKAQLAKARADLLDAQMELRNARAGGPPDQVAQINGDLRKAQIDKANFERTNAALKKLVAEKAATQDELDLNENQLAQAQATVQTLVQKKAALAAQAATNARGAELQAQHDREVISEYETDVRTATVVSPLDGTLYSLPVRTGDYVPVGQTLAAMADLHEVRVRAYVDEPDLGSLRIGEPVDISWDGMPGEVWTGRTETVPRQVVPYNVRTVGEVLCSVDNKGLQLIPNLNVDVKIEVQQRQHALVTPRGAVHTEGTQHYVYVVEGTTLHKRAVEVGIGNATEYQVVSGLKEGDRVALSADVELKDGMSVTPVEIRPR